MSYRKIVGVVDAMAAVGLIENLRQVPGGLTGMAQIMINAPRLAIIRPTNTILLRDTEGIEVDVKQTREVSRMNRKMQAINEAITSAHIVTASGVTLACPVARIFNVDPSLSRGGRMYATGSSWQNMPKAARRQLVINDEPVVEIDYATLHPALLYAEAKAPLPKDCYDVGRWDRDLVKIGLLTLINAKTERQALISLARNEFPDQDPGNQMPEARRLIEEIKRAHKPIACAFHSDAEARLMRQDSELAIAVVSSLLKQGIVALPIHDSFLVPASKQDALEAAMLKAAHAIGLQHIKITKVQDPVAAVSVSVQ
jgi:hypothetical protein